MQDYETEEQQIEAIKAWWKENGTSLIVGVAAGFLILGGWKYYVESTNSHRIEASDIYISIAKQIELNQVDDSVAAKVEQLMASYADTPYSTMSSLSLAGYHFENNEIDKSISYLQSVKANASEEEIKHIAILRLGRIYISQSKYDEAEAELNMEHPPAFNAGYEELKGDLYVARGEIEMARVAYDKAIEQSRSASQWLRLKRQDIGDSEMKKSAMTQPSV